MLIDIDAIAASLNLGEVEFFERESGLTMEQLAAGEYNVTAIMALITIQERRVNKAYTMEDARAVPVKDLEIKKPEEDPPKPERRAKAAS